MNRRLAGALALPVVLGGGVMTWQDFRAGKSRFSASGGIAPWRFSRATNPLLFWGATLLNALLSSLIIAGSVAVIAGVGEP